MVEGGGPGGEGSGENGRGVGGGGQGSSETRHGGIYKAAKVEGDYRTYDRCNLVFIGRCIISVVTVVI